MKLRNWQSFALSTAITCLGAALPARADLLLVAQPVTAAAGAVNDVFDVYITNLAASAVDVAAFNFEINTPSADIAFQQATTSTSLFPYIFAGNSAFGPVISINGPGQTLDVADVVSAPNSFTVVSPGASFGLGKIFFDVAPGAPAQIAPVNFNTNNAATSVSDQNGKSIALQFLNGSITVTPATSVPEPSMLVPFLVVFAGASLAVKCRASRA